MGWNIILQVIALVALPVLGFACMVVLRETVRVVFAPTNKIEALRHAGFNSAALKNGKLDRELSVHRNGRGIYGKRISEDTVEIEVAETITGHTL